MDKVAAAKLVGKLSQPEGMHAPTWKRLQKVLRALCRYLPDPYPSMRRLASDTGIPLRTVCRLLSRAVDLGLLERETREIADHLDGYSYKLSFLVPVSVPVSPQSGTEEEQSSSSSSMKRTFPPCRRMGAAAPPPGKTKGRKTNRWAGECAVCGYMVLPHTGLLHSFHPVHSFCDTGRPDPDRLLEYVMNSRREFELQQAIDLHSNVIGGDDEPLVVKAVPKATPAQRLAAKFEAKWVRLCLSEHPEWKIYRCLNKGAAIGYLNNTMLPTYSEEHVEAYMDAFFDTLLDPDGGLFMRERQQVWQLFTGWWGSIPVEDPKIKREERDQMRRWDEQARAMIEAEKAATGPAWKRIEEAFAAGRQPDPADAETVGYKVGRRRL